MGSCATRSRWFLEVAALTLGGFLTVPGVQAQQTPQGLPGVLLEQQRQAEEQQKKQQQQQEELKEQEAPPLIKKRKPPGARSPTGEATVKVTKIKFTGNRVIETAELENVVASVIGKELNLIELNEVAGRVSEYYVEQGYIMARVYIPPQVIEGKAGIVEMAVLEGNIGVVQTEGNTRYQSSTILRAMEPVLKRQVVHEGALETALNELNAYPGLKVRANLLPGAATGQTDIHLTAQERIPYAFTADINNYGSRLTGPWVYSGEIGLGNLLGIGDNLTLKGSKSDDNLFLTYASYLVPVTSFGTKLQLSWIHSENVIGEEFAFQRPVGRVDIASMDILQTITRASGFSLLVLGGFDFKTVRNILAVPGPSGTLQSKDELRVFRLGLRGDYRDPWLGRTYFGLTWHYFVDFWGGSEQNAPQTSFAGAGPGPTSKATADIARYQSLSFPFIQGLPVLPAVLNDSYLILRATGQLASDRLLSPERFTVGGYYTVRGYPVAELIGDSGYAATAELVVPVPSSATVPFFGQTWKEMIQVAAFVDHGGTFESPLTAAPAATPQAYLTGAGGGLRINLPFGVPQPVDRGVLTLKIDWASAIGRPRPTSRDQGISLNNVYGDGAAGILYVSATLRF